jgi:hypothetical protein
MLAAIPATLLCAVIVVEYVALSAGVAVDVIAILAAGALAYLAAGAGDGFGYATIRASLTSICVRQLGGIGTGTTLA